MLIHKEATRGHSLLRALLLRRVLKETLANNSAHIGPPPSQRAGINLHANVHLYIYI